MTRKTNLLFICNECSYETTKWLGRCPQCEAWNSFSELTKSKSLSKKTLTHKIQSLSDVPYAPEKKYKTGISEFDTVLGGGIVPGSLILLGGEPGIGKSTFLLQICDKLSQYGPILYNNGEESSQQIKLRSKRLKINEENIFLLDETDLGAIESSISQIKPIGIIIDSIQTVYRQDVLGLPGNISQVKEAANLFLNISKKENIFIFLVSHVTKEGNIAGPKALEHTVDVVLYIEGKKHNSFRILRNYKNRFGTTDEIGVFQMTEFGIHEVTNPSEHFIQDYNYSFSGTTLSAIFEGSRPLLIEVQALVSSTHFTFPKRMVDGTDVNKIYKLIAILEKVLGIILVQSDVYVNITGGVKGREPGIELSIIMAIYTSFKKISLKKSMLFIGEVGLAGEIRGVVGINQRVSEALKLGIQVIIVPKKNSSELTSSIKKGHIFSAASILEVVEFIQSS